MKTEGTARFGFQGCEGANQTSEQLQQEWCRGAELLFCRTPETLHDRMEFSVRTVQRLMKRVANRAHISRPVTPHILRHTFAVTAVQKGISLPSLQRLLGDDHLTTTEIYLNLSPEEVIREFRAKW